MDRVLSVIVNPHAGGGRAERLLPARRGGAARPRRDVPRRAHALDRARARAGARPRATPARSRPRSAATAWSAPSPASCAAAPARSRVLPGGRGNDFARKLGIGSDPVAACAVIAAGRERAVDLAEVDGERLPRDRAARASTPTSTRSRSSTRLKLGSLVYAYGTAAGAARVAAGALAGRDRRRGARVRRVLRGRGQLRRVRRRHVPRARRGARRRPARRRAHRGHAQAPLPARTCRRCSRARTCTRSRPALLRAREVAFHADRPFTLYADGDPIAELPATVRVAPGALRVLAPEAPDDARAEARGGEGGRRPRTPRRPRRRDLAARQGADAPRAAGDRDARRAPRARLGRGLRDERQDDDRRDGRRRSSSAPARGSCTTAPARTWPAASPRALAAAARRGGRELDGDLGLFEVDEFWLGPVVEELEPRALLLSNLFRDQLDRYGELETIADRWAAVVAARAGRTALVLNADDPLVADLGRATPTPSTSASRTTRWPCAELQHASDSKHCRRCGHAVRLRGRLPRAPRPLPLPELRRAPAGARGRRAATSSCDGIRARRVHAAHAGRRGARRAAPPRPLQRLQRARRRGAVPARSARRWRPWSPAWAPSRRRSAAPRRSTSAGRQASILLVKNPAGANEVLRTLALEGARARRARRAQRPHRRRPRRLLDLGRRLGAARPARAPHDLRGHARRRAGAADEVRRRGSRSAARRRGPAARRSTRRSPTATGPLYALPTYTALLELRDLLAARGQAEEYWR